MKTRIFNLIIIDERSSMQSIKKGCHCVEAYKSLALCYRDGEGVEKSWLNMICMYATYSQKTGGDIEDVVELFDEKPPFRLLFEIMDSPSFNEEAEAKLERLKQSAPAVSNELINYNKDMKVKLNESKLKQIVAESVKKVLKESESTYSLQRVVSREIDDAVRTLSLCQSDDEVINITKRLVKMLNGILISHNTNNFKL